MPDIAADKQNPLAMSDEDFLNQPLPGAEVIQEVPADNAGENKTEVETPTTKVEESSEEVETKSNVASTQEASSKPEANGGNVPTKVEQPVVEKEAATASTPESKSADGGKSTQDKDKPLTDESKSADQTTTAVDYESFYKRVMAPFKANGKQIELRSPDEVIQLLQMGANYTRKMQDMAPHRKTLLMLENAQLLDPDKLSFLIDLNNGDQKAIQKLLKDKGVDPMSIDTSQDSSYLGGNHKVSDEEANFRTVLDELQADPAGKATLQTIHSTWDQASKDVLWSEPQVMQAIHEQRENGIYDRIAAEVNRQRTLGAIPASLKFIDAYKVVGDAMQAAGAFNDLVKPSSPAPASAPGSSAAAPTQTVAKEPVATRVVTPKPAVSNSDLASAAAATRSTPREVKQLINPLAMSDDEFLKQFENRV